MFEEFQEAWQEFREESKQQEDTGPGMFSGNAAAKLKRDVFGYR